MIHAAAGKTFDVAIAGVRSLEQQPGDLVAARNGFDQAVVSGIVELEPAISHRNFI